MSSKVWEVHRDTDFYIYNLQNHQLFNDINRFALYGGWALKGNDASTKILAKSSKNARLDINRNHKADTTDVEGEWGVIVTGAVGKGRFIIFGDDVIFQNRFIKGNNLTLARNLSSWFSETVNRVVIKM